MGIYTPLILFVENRVSKYDKQKGTGARKWGGGCDRVDGLGRGKKGRGIAREKTGAKPIDNFLTQSRVKERNEKHQKRKKERKD